VFLMQCQNVQRTRAEFSDHADELGIFLFFALTGATTVIGAQRPIWDLMRGARMELNDRRLDFLQRTDDEFT
jgi:hypothetical protein